MKNYKILFVLVVTLCGLLPILLYSQSVDTAWVRRYSGSGNADDEAKAVVIDNSGNIYVTGYSMNPNGHYDYATVKYNSNGVQQWVQRYNGQSNLDDKANALALDASDHLYVTGYSVATSSGRDCVTIKYSSNGDTIWTRRYTTTGYSDDVVNAIAVDSLGSIYVTGYCNGPATTSDFLTIKYNSNGETLWTRSYNGAANGVDGASAVAIDHLGNLYVTGLTYITGTNNYDYLTIKYYPNGDTAWTRSYNGPGNWYDNAYAIAVDHANNVYVTGGSVGSTGNINYATIKYYADGSVAWTNRYSGTGTSGDYGYALAIDDSNNVCVTGHSSATNNTYDITTIKYNTNGNMVWSKVYNGSANDNDEGYAITTDTSYNVYVTGYTTSLNTSRDFVTIKYYPNGDTGWVRKFSGQGSNWDFGNAIALDNLGNVYITGTGYNSTTGSDYTTIKYVQTYPGVEEHTIHTKTSNVVEIYPNPAKIYFNISFSLFALHSSLKIYDVTGKVVKNEELKGKNCRVSLDGIKNGVYFVKVGDEMVKEKLVVTK